MKQNKPNNSNAKWLQFINIPIQMGVIIFLFAFFGKWLDNKNANESKIFTIIFVLVGVILALYNVIVQVNKLNNEK